MIRSQSGYLELAHKTERRTFLYSGTHSRKMHLHRQDLARQGIEHQTERLQGHGAEQRTVVALAENDGRSCGVFSDLETTLRHPALDGCTVRQSELNLSIRFEPESAPGLFGENRIDCA